MVGVVSLCNEASKMSGSKGASEAIDSAETEQENPCLKDIRLDGNGHVSEPSMLVGLPLSQIRPLGKRQPWVKLRKNGWVPAET